MLARANMSRNRIDRIADLTHHLYLNSLNLARNAISEISGIQGLKNLQILRLSHNRIEVRLSVEILVQAGQRRGLRGSGLPYSDIF